LVGDEQVANFGGQAVQTPLTLTNPVPHVNVDIAKSHLRV